MSEPTPYARAMTEDADRFFEWRQARYPNQTWTPEMMARYRMLTGPWNPHGHRPHGQREWR